jgi:hypothetical protein
LENQARLAAERVTPEQDRGDPQMQMPLIVEVKCEGRAARRRRRVRRRPETDQPELGEL